MFSPITETYPGNVIDKTKQVQRNRQQFCNEWVNEQWMSCREIVNLKNYARKRAVFPSLGIGTGQNTVIRKLIRFLLPTNTSKAVLTIHLSFRFKVYKNLSWQCYEQAFCLDGCKRYTPTALFRLPKNSQNSILWRPVTIWLFTYFSALAIQFTLLLWNMHHV